MYILWPPSGGKLNSKVTFQNPGRIRRPKEFPNFLFFKIVVYTKMLTTLAFVSGKYPSFPRRAFGHTESTSI